MTSENDLIQKLMISKQIMEKHNQTPRGGLPSMDTYSTPEVATYNAPPATYNLPQDMLQEASVPVSNTHQPMTQDRVMASKLPDEIKRLMIEHPIAQAQQQGGGATLSDDLIERASRLMKNQNSNNYIPESVKPKTQQQPQTQSTSQIDYKLIKKMIREAVDEALQENGLMVESSEKANEMLSFKVGKHLFEGKVTKIKKLV